MISVANNLYITGFWFLGDIIAIKPLVKLWDSQYSQIWWETNSENMTSAIAIMQDLANVRVVDRALAPEFIDHIQSNQSINQLDLRSIMQSIPLQYEGDHTPTLVTINWDRQVYEYFDVCYTKRYTQWSARFDLSKAWQLYHKLNPTNEPYILWHPASSQHTYVTNIDLPMFRTSLDKPPLNIIDVKPEYTSNILDYKILIENAQEIHCVPSSFYTLVDSMHKETHAELYYHDIRSSLINQCNCWANDFRWNVISYNKKY